MTNNLADSVADPESRINASESSPASDGIQQVVKFGGEERWRNLVAFEHRKRNENGGYSTTPVQNPNEIVGGLFHGTAKQSIRVLYNDEDDALDIYIEKKETDSWLFRTFLDEIPKLQYYENVLIGNAFICLSEPYEPLYHNRKKLEKISAELNTDEGRHKKDQLDALFQLYNLDSVKNYLAGEPDEAVKFSELWKLYPPDSSIVVRALGEERVIRTVISTATVVPTTLEDPERFEITCTEISYNGKNFGERRVIILQEYFSGSMDIAELEACPTKYYLGLEELTAKLTARGKVWKDIWTKPVVTVAEYHGNGVSLLRVESERNLRNTQARGLRDLSRDVSLVEGETFMTEVS